MNKPYIRRGIGLSFAKGSAVSVYVHIAIIRRRLHIEENLHTILQILSLTMFEKIPLKQLLNTSTRPVPAISKNKQLNLFSF